GVVGCAGMLAAAALCAAHARLTERGEWVLNEKGLVERAGLGRTHAILAGAGRTAGELRASVAAMSAAIGVPVPAAR
ncbi:MAG TPA: nucleotidyltransferase domain-containing protein, partial [Solirubrobacteraceae bacterium]|nr:nucleotidyltransferase domain-containing protein [Solirubrobacteraceae bacterium]